jgi:GAF domain-containing protein
LTGQVIALPFDAASNPRWKLLEVASLRLAAAPDLDTIIAVVRATARNVTSADGVCFVLRDGEQCHYVEEDAIAPLWKGQRFPLTACISGWSMLKAKTAVIADVFADPRIPHAVYRQTFVKSLIMTPVGEDTPMAALGAYWRDRRPFSEREIRAVEQLGEMVGTAMHRTRAAA